VHPQLSVSAVSSWAWTLDDDLHFWTAHGIDHVGLSWRKLAEAPGGPSAAAARVRDAGLRVSDIGELGWCALADPATWTAHRDRLAAAIEAAVVTGAGCLVVLTGPAGPLDWDDAAGALGEFLEPLRPLAAEAGVRLAVENTSPMRVDLSFVTTLRDAVDLAVALGTGVCVEITSCFAERDVRTTIAAAAGHGVLDLVQVGDVVLPSLVTPDRAVPGDGHVPLARLLGAVLATGYRGACSLEVVGPRIDAEGCGPAILRSLAHLEPLLAAAGA
jgi:sugar phosphate isomerase/epimerase